MHPLGKCVVLAFVVMVLATISCRASIERTHHSTPQVPGVQGVKGEAIWAWAAREGLHTQHPDLIQDERIQFELIPTTAFAVYLKHQIPEVEGVLVLGHGGAGWTLQEKALTQGWKDVVRDVLLDLGPLNRDQAFSEPASLARDLARLLVDPDPRFGRVLASKVDIPTDLDASDVYRDLKASGVSQEKINEILLEPLSEEPVPPSASRASGGSLTFYTWHYFGGEVIRWTVEALDSEPTISRRQVGVRVGSYDLYF